MTSLQPAVEHQADSWPRGLTDTEDHRPRRIRVAETPEPASSLTAHRLLAPPEGWQEVHWLANIEAEMLSYLDLVPNWDSYGGGPAAKETVDTAIIVARIMAEYGFSRPAVCPEPSGGVLMEWEKPGRALTIDLDGNDGFSFVYESSGMLALEGDIERFVSFLNTGVQPF